LTGISLTSNPGSLSIGTTTITNPGTSGITESNCSATINYGNATVNGSGSVGVQLGGTGVGNTGTITFGDLDIAPDSGQRGLLAQDNTNTITTTSGTISTSGAVAVEMTRSSSTTPLQIALTTVSANGGTSGIILTNTSGSFSIAGTGSAGSGGTIQNTTATGILLNNVQSVSFSRMNIQSSGDDGINGTTVNGFSLSDSSVINNGNSTSDEGIEFNNLLGTSTITNATVTGNSQ
jgi:hypothetical protein